MSNFGITPSSPTRQETSLVFTLHIVSQTLPSRLTFTVLAFHHIRLPDTVLQACAPLRPSLRLRAAALQLPFRNLSLQRFRPSHPAPSGPPSFLSGEDPFSKLPFSFPAPSSFLPLGLLTWNRSVLHTAEHPPP